MGVMNYYLSFAIDKSKQKEIEKIYSNQYSDFFNFGIKEGTIQEKATVYIESCFENFLVSNYKIFDFIEQIKRKNEDFFFTTNEIKQSWHFVTKSDFLNFMYQKWEKKLDRFYCQYGTLVIPPKKYWKTHRKLFKKYYRKTNISK